MPTASCEAKQTAKQLESCAALSSKRLQQADMAKSIYLSALEFSLLAGVTERHARRVLVDAADGKTWAGSRLSVRKVFGRGGRSGLRYEVALSSLPEALQKAFRDQNPDTCAIVAHVSGEVPAALPVPIMPHVPRIATKEQGKRALDIFKQIEPATHDGLTAKERGAAVQGIVKATGLPRKTVYNYLQRYRSHGLEGLMRKRPFDAGQARVGVSVQFDRAWLAAGHPEDLLSELSDFVDLTLKGLWKSRAASSGENDIAMMTGFRLFERCTELGMPLPREYCKIGRRRVRKWRHFSTVEQSKNDAGGFRNTLPTIQRDWTSYLPMKCVIADVKHLDVLVTRDDGSKAYPKLIAFMDAGTGRCFAYPVLCPERRSINQGLVIEALIAMCHHKHWGYPRQLYLDNGSEFGGLDKIIPALSLINRDEGREIIRAQPYNANAKPIEALFARLDRYCFSNMPGYTGPDRTNKKTQNVGRDPVAWLESWESFKSNVGGLIAYYHTRPIGGQWGGKSCNETFHEKIDQHKWKPWFPKPMALEIAFCKRKSVMVRGGVIKHGGKVWYHAELLKLTPRAEVELLIPWKVGVPPGVILDDGTAFLLSEDHPYRATDPRGAVESARRKQAYKRGIAELDRSAPTIDPIPIKLRIANSVPEINIPGRPRFLDEGATVHQFPTSTRLLNAEVVPSKDEAARRRELERRHTERLERMQKRGK